MLPKVIDGVPLSVVICPKCANQCAAASMKLVPFNLETLLRCPSCARVTISRHWRCTCDTSWHLCHKHVLKACVQCTSFVSRKSVRLAKRPAATDLQSILDDELKREAKTAKREGTMIDLPNMIDLGASSSSLPLRSGMLTQNLRERFPHISK